MSEFELKLMDITRQVVWTVPCLRFGTVQTVKGCRGCPLALPSFKLLLLLLALPGGRTRTNIMNKGKMLEPSSMCNGVMGRLKGCRLLLLLFLDAAGV